MQLVLTSLVDLLLQAGLVVVLGLLGLAINWFSKKTGLEIDAKQRAVLDEVIGNAISLARSRLVGPDGQVTVNLKNDALTMAAQYVVASVPGALKHFGIDPATAEGKLKLAKMVEARLGQYGL